MQAVAAELTGYAGKFRCFLVCCFVARSKENFPYQVHLA